MAAFFRAGLGRGEASAEFWGRRKFPTVMSAPLNDSAVSHEQFLAPDVMVGRGELASDQSLFGISMALADCASSRSRAALLAP